MATPRTDPRHQAGATALATGDKKSKGPLWAILGLLALLALAALAFLLIRNAADDGDDTGIDATDDAQGGESGSDVGGDPGADDEGGEGGEGGSSGGSTTTAAEDEAGSASTAAPSGGGGGELATADGGPILPPPSGGLGDQVDQQVAGTAMVESVVSDEGFWVGQGPGERIFVFLTPEARNSEGESPFQVEAGQTIELTGTVAAAPSDPASLGVEGAEGADELTQVGGFIEATEVALSE